MDVVGCELWWLDGVVVLVLVDLVVSDLSGFGVVLWVW